jgi:3-oxoacyl-[acyl-carrier-protein] synthase II
VKAVVIGVGWVNGSGIGCGRDTPFSMGSAEALPTVARKDVFLKPFPHYGRMDKYSRLGLAGIAFALRDAGLDEWTAFRHIAIMASTKFGCLSTDGDYFDTVMPEGGRFASPNLFAYALHNTYLGEAAIHFGLTGAAFVINESPLTGISGMRFAMESVTRGVHEAVVTGISDAGAPQFMGLADRVIPGALFFVIQKASPAGGSSYGELSQDGSGEIFFEGDRVEDLNSLARMCTDSIHGK